MSCIKCGNGVCGCGTITLPIGPPGTPGTNGTNGTAPVIAIEPAGINCVYGGISVTDSLGAVTYVCNGAPGVAGTNPVKYAAIISVPAGTSVSAPYLFPIFGTAIGTLVSTTVSTPQTNDFNYTIWFKTSSTTWIDIASNPAFSTSVQGVVYDTGTNVMSIQFVTPGTYRINIFG